MSTSPDHYQTDIFFPSDLPPPSSTYEAPSTSSSSPSKTDISRDLTYPPPSPVKRIFSPPTHLENHQRKQSPMRSPQHLIMDSNFTEAHTPLSAKSSNVKPTAKISRSNAIKSKGLKSMSIIPPPVPQENERHYIKSALSSGSLKENKVEGVVKKDSIKAGKATTSSDRSATGRRVLRQRK